MQKYPYHNRSPPFLCTSASPSIPNRVGKIYESGLTQVWVRKWWPKQTFCSGSLVTQARTLNLMDVQSSFYVLAIGLGLAGVVLTAETGYTILHQGLHSSAWAQGKMGMARRLVARWFSWGSCTEGENSSGNPRSPGGQRISSVATRGGVEQNGRRSDGRDGGIGNTKARIGNSYKRNNAKAENGGVRGNHEASGRYEINHRDALKYRDFYFNRGYDGDDSPGFQNENDRNFNSNHGKSEFTNLSSLPNDPHHHNGFLNIRNSASPWSYASTKSASEPRGRNSSKFEIELHDNQL